MSLNVSGNDFTFCPSCGEKNIVNKMMRHWVCNDCGFDLYNNVAAAVGLIIKNNEGKILLERRAKEPRKGFLAFPGGFVDPDESAEQAAFRECEEEIGIKPDSLKYIGSFPNTYEYKNIVYKTCDLFFEAAVSDSSSLKFQADEVLSVEWRKAVSESDIDEIPLAFDSAARILKLWLKLNKKDLL